MTLLVISLIVFIVWHLLPAMPKYRAPLIQKLGEKQYHIVFGIVSILALIGVIYGYSISPFIEIWSPPSFFKHITHLFMIFVFPLVIASILPNGKIKEKVKFPLVSAVKIWAFAHLLSNGDLASMILFIGLLAYAVIDRISLKKRIKAKLIHYPKAVKDYVLWDMIAIVGGLAIYGFFIVYGHAYLIGVPLF